MRKETCAVCGKIVYVEDGEEFEWDAGAILCHKLEKFFCSEHKPCCAADVHENECDGINQEEEEDDEDDPDDYDDEEDIGEDEGFDEDLGEDPSVDIGG